MFLPVFLLGGGGVLLTDGLGIYRYYQAQNTALTLFYCTDIYGLVIPPDIHDGENYIPIEFAGVIVALVFYVSCVDCTLL